MLDAVNLARKCAHVLEMIFNLSLYKTITIFFFCGAATQRGLLIFEVFIDHTQRRTAVGRTPLDERSARRRGIYLTTHNTHNRQTSMLPVGFEPMISSGERPQTYALDRAATGTGKTITNTNIK